MLLISKGGLKVIPIVAGYWESVLKIVPLLKLGDYGGIDA